MKSKALKSVILIALVCLSMGAFAQVATNVCFTSLPTLPAGKPQNVRVRCTYYMPNETRQAETTAGYIVPGGYVIVYFPGTVAEANRVTSTKVDLFFYDNYTGTGATFPRIPAILSCPADFPPNGWWISDTPSDKYTH